MPDPHPAPQTPGYYWAKWVKATDDTPERDDSTPMDEWEIVQVGSLPSWNPFVLIPGVDTAQAVDGFFWGPKVADLNGGPASFHCLQCGVEVVTGSGTSRRSHSEYCSNRCRVAAHRLRNKIAGGQE